MYTNQEDLEGYRLGRLVALSKDGQGLCHK